MKITIACFLFLVADGLVLMHFDKPAWAAACFVTAFAIACAWAASQLDDRIQ